MQTAVQRVEKKVNEKGSQRGNRAQRGVTSKRRANLHEKRGKVGYEEQSSLK